MSERYRDQLRPPLDTAIHWVEHVIRTKGAHHLHSAAVDMPFYAYHNLDILAFVCIIVYLVFLMLRKIYRFGCQIVGGSPTNSPKLKVK